MLELWLLSVVTFITVTVMSTFIILIVVYLSTDPYPDNHREATEECYLDPKTSEFIKIPSGLLDRPQVELSIVVPAYNEFERMPNMLDEALLYLRKRKEENSKFSFEIIVVDDGSLDRTSEMAMKYSKEYGSDVVRVIKFLKNRGKGAAVKSGVLCSRGRKILFADADGATKFSDVEKLEDAFSASIAESWNGSMAVICGSRAHLEKDVIAKRNLFRNLLMYGFKMCVWILCVRDVQDTQCGFKLLSRSAARVLFHNLHVNRWAFDVDLLYLARYFEMYIKEVPVHWHEVAGTKLIPVFSWLQMAKDLLLIRLRYSLGAWKIERVHI